MATGRNRVDRRILFVCSADFRGPSEKQAAGFAQQLARRGYHVALSIGGARSSFDEELISPHPAVEILERRFRGPTPAKSDVDGVRRFAPDLIHAFNPRVPVVAAARAYVQATGAPLCVHFEDDEWGLAGGRSDESVPRRTARRVLPLASRAYPPMWPFATSASLRWVGDHAAALDALTPALAACVTRRLERDCAVVRPVSPELSEQARDPGLDLTDIPDDVRVVVYTGGIFGAHVDDFRLLLQAMAIVRDKAPCVLAHAGGFAPRFQPTELAAEAGLGPDDAIFLGHVPHGSLQALLARADVLVQPGAPSEFNRLRLPSKLQTYLASMRPTVTFSVGIGEELVDREEVLKTYTARPAELAERLLELLRDRELARRIAAGGRRAAVRLFDAQRNTDRLLEHYSGVLSDPAGFAA